MLQAVAEIRVERPGRPVENDRVVVEEPLQIRVDGTPLAVTMRTPGADRELAAGFVLTEGLIDGAADLASVDRARDVFDSDHPENSVDVRLRQAASAERLERAERDFRAVASCGVCGKKTIAGLRQILPPIEAFAPPLDLIQTLPERMRPEQHVFARTGGIHAAALFDEHGEFLVLFEDIGRHNAVDKVIGHFLLHALDTRGAEPLPLSRRILVSSGRAGFEIVQKAARAGIPALAAVGAASSLALELAREAGMTIYSFVSPTRANRHL